MPSETAALHILVMDDDAVIRSEISRQLKALGLSVTTCDTATEAKAIWEMHRFDLVICDIFVKVDGQLIPDGGVSFLGWLQSRTKVPIIAITGEDRWHLEEMRQLGASVCLVKPLNYSDLAGHVINLLDFKPQPV